MWGHFCCGAEDLVSPDQRFHCTSFFLICHAFVQNVIANNFSRVFI